MLTNERTNERTNLSALCTVFCCVLLWTGCPWPGVLPLALGDVDFDGVDDYVNIGNPSSLQLTGAMTLSAWIKADSIDNSGNYNS